VNRALQVALRDLETDGTGTDGGSCNSRLALFTTQRQRALQLVIAFAKTCLILKRRIKSYLPFAGIIISSPYSPR
jgi:hypothetical protein